MTIAAIVPAAGASRRMGQPKLLLPFGGETLIARVVRALRAGGAEPVIVVSPPADQPEGPPLAEEARRAGGRVVIPVSRPAEMRESVELAIVELGRVGIPDALILTPGDTPGITAEVVSRLIEGSSQWPGRIVIPVVGGRRGHPIWLPWPIAQQIPKLPAGVGINALVAAHAESLVELEFDRADLTDDLDTPEDLARWQARPKATVCTLQVRLFAIAKERVGKPQIDLFLPLPASIAELRYALATQFPALEALAPRVMIAVDSQYADDTTLIQPDSQIALIPPVSGGTAATPF